MERRAGQVGVAGLTASQRSNTNPASRRRSAGRNGDSGYFFWGWSRHDKKPDHSAGTEEKADGSPILD